MQSSSTQYSRLSELVRSLQARGVYSFTKELAVESLGVSGGAVDAAAQRLKAKGALASPRRGFYLIVPAEYQLAGAPPPTWFIEQLMGFHKQPYYVGLLSAAELHGAAHHRPQEFQVVTNVPLRSVVVGRTKLRFFVKRRVDETPTIQLKAHTGYFHVSTPEATAFDLVRYVDSAGYFDNVATVFAELQEKIEGRQLVATAQKGVELSVVQRCGYLLDLVGAEAKTARLAKWIENKHPRPTPLRPDRPARGEPVDERWDVVVNADVESEV